MSPYMYFVSKYVWKEICIIMYLCAHEYMYVCACMYVDMHA